jgi:hypothetical protein
MCQDGRIGIPREQRVRVVGVVVGPATRWSWFTAHDKDGKGPGKDVWERVVWNSGAKHLLFHLGLLCLLLRTKPLRQCGTLQGLV